MTPTFRQNGLALLVAFSGLGVVATAFSLRATAALGGDAQSSHVLDAMGARVPTAAYRRIVSTGAVTDEILRELVEPSRVAAFSRYGATAPTFGHRYGGFPLSPVDLVPERLLALEPDLVLTHAFREIAHVERLREAGLVVLELGEMRGVTTLLANIDVIARVVREEARGRRLARAFRRRIESVAGDVSGERRPRALYLGLHGGHLFGGTRGTSFHDVITYAGLEDVAAMRYEGWPSFRYEDVLALAPDHVVTQRGMRSRLCAHDALGQLEACATRQGVIELPTDLVASAGLSMLDAAEALHDAVFDEGAAP